MSNQTPISYDVNEIKQDLISWLQTKEYFSDFNFEGSAISTIIDLLVFNDQHMAYSANMISNESFLQSAQLRSNVVAHAQRLSYTPKSKTASTIRCSLKVNPSSADARTSIVCEKGSSFINTVGGITYTFTNLEDVVLYKVADGSYKANDVELKQGTLTTSAFIYSKEQGYITIPNYDLDSSTIRLFEKPDAQSTLFTEYLKVQDLLQVAPGDPVYYLNEVNSEYRIEFGKDVLGQEPLDQSYLEAEYILNEANNANGLDSLIAASTIGGYADVSVVVDVEAFGGADRDSIERIKFLAPKTWASAKTAVRDFSYESILLENFPFIRSAKAWGGEENNPPYFGRVYIAVIPQEGFTVSSRVLDDVSNKMNNLNVLSITPVVVNADYFYLDLSIDFIKDLSKSNASDEQIKAFITSTVEQYSNDIKDFGQYYNNSLLIDQLRTNPAVESVEIDKVIGYDIKAQVGISTKYVINYQNALLPSTFKLTDFIINPSVDVETVEDDGLGSIIYTTTTGSITTSTSIGTIDYSTGSVSFDAEFYQANPKAVVQSVSDNFFTKQKMVVYINQVSV